MKKKKNLKEKKELEGLKEFISKYWIVALLILSLVFFLWLNSIDPVLMWDENVYLGNARSHITTSHFTEDFRPPLLEYIIAGVWMITGESLFMAKLTIIMFNLGSILVFYLISKKLFRNAFLPTVLFAISSEFVYWGFRVYGDSVSLFFVLLSFLLFMGEKDLLLALSGLFAAMAFLTRFPLALFAIAIGVYCLIKCFIKRKWRPLLLFCAGLLVGVLPWLIYNSIKYSNPLWDVFALFNAVKEYTSLQPASFLLIFLLKSLFLLLLFLPLGIYGIIRIGKHRKSGAKKKEIDSWIIISIYLIISLAYYLFFVKLKLMRYNLVIIPFIILICYVGITEFFKLIKAKKGIITALTILLIILMIIPLNAPIWAIKQKGVCNKAVNEAIIYIDEKTSPGETILGNEWVGYGYKSNLKAFSLWDDDVNMLIKLYKPTYIIHHSSKGVVYDISILEESSKLSLEKLIKGKCFDIKIFKALQQSP